MNQNELKIITHKKGDELYGEISSSSIVITNIQDAVELLGNMYFQGYGTIILHIHNLPTEFFDLQNKMAGEILQKFSNYRMRLAIIGSFENYKRKSLRDFIRESNKYGHIIFLKSVEELQFS